MIRKVADVRGIVWTIFERHYGSGNFCHYSSCRRQAPYCVESIYAKDTRWYCTFHTDEFIRLNKIIKEEKMEFRVEVTEAPIPKAICDHDGCDEFAVHRFNNSPMNWLWLCDEHGKYLKTLVESQDKGQEGTLLKDLPDGTVLEWVPYKGEQDCPNCEGGRALTVKFSTKYGGDYLRIQCNCGYGHGEIKMKGTTIASWETKECRKCFKPYSLAFLGREYPQVPETNYDTVPIERNSFSVSKIPEGEAYYCMAHKCQGEKHFATSKIYGYFGCREERFDLALCDRHGVSPVDKPVEYCKECGNVKEGS